MTTTAQRRGFAGFLRFVAAATGLILLAIGSLSALSNQARAVSPVSTVPGYAFEVTDANFRWGMNNEVNNKAHGPGYNFFSAGKIPNPGQGGTQLKSADWKSTVGAVSIEKKTADGTYRPATWADRRITADGAEITDSNSGLYSDHRVVVSGGKGFVDPSNSTAQIEWEGDWTVLFYSGYSYFYVSNPVLTVVKGVATLTATLSGHASDRDDWEKWDEIEPRTVVLANWSAINLGSQLGFRAVPEYLGVNNSQPDQEPDGPYWGSFPQSFVDYQVEAGLGAFWYSSGARTDPAKVPLEFSLAYSAGAQVDPMEPTLPPVVPGSPPTATVTVTKTVTVTAAPDEKQADRGVRTEPFEVTDAAFRWGMNNESNNKAHGPGFNFLSAGKIRNPGRGGQSLSKSEWAQVKGQVRIEKAVDGKYVPATWEGLQTTSSGYRIPSANSGSYSGHEVVIGGGRGSVDPVKGSAKIKWRGSFSVIYYSGLSFFYVSDPVLKITNSKATVTATLSGFASSMDDTDKWSALKPQKVVLADLGKVDLTQTDGFTVTPAYSKRKVTIPAAQSQQVRTGPHWGAFPQSFVDFQLKAGTGSFWYSSGIQTDSAKVPLPLTIRYNAAMPALAPPPQATGASAPTAVTQQLLRRPLATQPPIEQIPLADPLMASAMPKPPAAVLAVTELNQLSSSTRSVPAWALWSSGLFLLLASLASLAGSWTARRP